MFSIACRRTGTGSDAEAIVQEAFLRVGKDAAKDAEVESPKAYLATITTRLAIDHLRSARVRRESYVATWLPEPLLAGAPVGPAASRDDADPAELAETSDSLSMAAADGGDLTSLLERLAPDVVFYGDSGGKGETTFIAPVIGRDRVARVIRLSFERTLEIGASLRGAWVNGQPGVLARDADG